MRNPIKQSYSYIVNACFVTENLKITQLTHEQKIGLTMLNRLTKLRKDTSRGYEEMGGDVKQNNQHDAPTLPVPESSLFAGQSFPISTTEPTEGALFILFTS